MITNRMRAGLLFDPVAGTVPSGFLTTDEYNATAQTFTNPATTTALAHPELFNAQGQSWVEDTSDVDGRVVNRMNALGTTNCSTSFEFLFTGTALDIAFIGTSSYDSQVYIEIGGKMYKAKDAPLAGTTTGAMNRRLVFGAFYIGRIRVHLSAVPLIGVRHEESAIIKRSPDRPLSIIDGDVLGNPTTRPSSAVSTYLFERTGFVWARHGEYGTGFFFNGTTTVTADTAAGSTTRFFSADRKAKLATSLAAKPLFYVLTGSLDDPGSAATGLASGPMSTRAKNCYNWIRSQDPYCHILHVSPAPWIGNVSISGTTTTAPAASSIHDKNRTEQELAIATTPRASYLNIFGPTQPLWVGSGNNGSPTTSQQAALFTDPIYSPNALGAKFIANRIADEMAKTLVYVPRARRQV